MRNLFLTLPALVYLAVASASAVRSDFNSHSLHQQAPMVDQGPSPLLPTPDRITAPEDKDNSDQPGSLIIADVLPRERTISIFASLVRDVGSVADRLQDSGVNATVLAPINSALAALPRKPWEDTDDYQRLGSAAYHGADGESRAQKNLQRFIEAHIVPGSPLKVGEKTQALAGNTVWLEETDGKNYIQPGNVEVQSVADKVSNGEVWILRGVINPAS